MVVALLFLSETKTADHSWLLGVKHWDGTQGSMNEDDLYTYRLSNNTSLGADLRNLLANATFHDMDDSLPHEGYTQN